MERRDSKKGGNKQKQKDNKGKPDDGDDDRKRKSSGVLRSKPCREIYRPPSVRKGRGNHGDHNMDYHSGVNQTGGTPNNAQSSPARPTSRPFNVYAKEFQYSPRGNHMTFSRSQSITYYANPNQDYYQNPILATSGCYPLQQSKSSGNLNNFYQLWSQQQAAAMAQPQQQANVPARRRNQNSLSEAIPVPLDSNESQYFRLQQSKSSGNIPSNRMHRSSKTVRFDFEDLTSSPINNDDVQLLPGVVQDSRILKMQRDLELAGQGLDNLRLNGPCNNDILQAKYDSQLHFTTKNGPDNFHHPGVRPKFNPSPQQLQKSYTFLGMPNSVLNPSKLEAAKVNSAIKRSKSYTPRSATKSSVLAPPHNSLATISAATDFDIEKWPKAIQEAVTTAVIGADRIPARHRINMVGAIFATLLSQSATKEDLAEDIASESTESNSQDGSKDGHEENNQLHGSAVNIFLYFIQREKDRTVMESVLNTSFATYQELQKFAFKNLEFRQNSPQLSSEDPANVEISDKWVKYLQFLSSMYGKVKIIRVQNSSQPGFKPVGEMHNSVLSLLCDCCLLTVRSPLFHTLEIMDLLFTIMTSIGREMEGTFPAKMKQILAAVRDTLLGIKPYVVGNEASSRSVQKTLMQLIELHAANWHLPASAVRYYYSNPT